MALHHDSLHTGPPQKPLHHVPSTIRGSSRHFSCFVSNMGALGATLNTWLKSATDCGGGNCYSVMMSTLHKWHHTSCLGSMDVYWTYLTEALWRNPCILFCHPWTSLIICILTYIYISIYSFRYKHVHLKPESQGLHMKSAIYLETHMLAWAMTLFAYLVLCDCSSTSGPLLNTCCTQSAHHTAVNHVQYVIQGASPLHLNTLRESLV